MDVLSDVLTAMRTGRPHAARRRSQAPWGVRFSTAEAAGCHVVLRGTCWLTVAGSAPIALSPGDVVLVPQQCTYALTDRPGTPTVDFDLSERDVGQNDDVDLGDDGTVTETLCAAYFLDRGRTHPLLLELPPVIHLPAIAGAHTSLRQAVDLLGAELAGARHGADVIVPALIDALLLLIIREWLENNTADRLWATALNDPTILAALRTIHGRPEAAWTVESLAQSCGLSRATFASKFKNLVGMPPLTYLTWWRMTLAARELRTTDAPVAAIARRAGYTSDFAFTKAFKREFGVSPQGYRLQRRGNPSRR
ncbi:AraC family transcriptional regulator [Saccharopolyspora elongata]|uniref:AraC family transcriptional regulator n=1 Tax=Saccharopolyspora elongata TaxID=2530387 RepID=A0A4R4YW85_9PSEU|nr:AraC family transcriptional regulator [Saccharopolyspora elongata]TDD48794.1 AraC family transcriptional regulator [Saccharopolyspora elongata]